VKHS
jgi:hypothetical protein